MQKIVTTNLTNQYTLGVGNRLASWGTNGVARYNTAGCLTNMVSNTDGRELNLSWDERYQLTSVDSNEVGGRVSYDYNVLGQRVARSEVVSGVTNTEYYIHDGVNIVADLDSDKNLIRSYSYAPGYDNIISMTTYGDETNTYFYIRNHNNSVVALVDEDGDIAESYEYSAYGEVTVFDSNDNELDESTLGNRYTFQGREIDWSTGLYNFRARWYDAETGRWLSKDPIGINGGLNQYVFCGNNPVMFVDPEGLFTSEQLEAMKADFIKKALLCQAQANHLQDMLSDMERADFNSKVCGSTGTAFGLGASGLYAYGAFLGASYFVCGTGASVYTMAFTSTYSRAITTSCAISASSLLTSSGLSGGMTVVGTYFGIYFDIELWHQMQEYRYLIISETELMHLFFDLARKVSDMMRDGKCD